MDWLEKYEKARLQNNKKFTIDVISTSYSELDKALGIGGIPCGKIVEIAGHSSVGKSSLALDIVASAQVKGLQVIYFDLDNKFEKDFATMRAVNCDELLVFRPEPDQPENIILALNEFLSKDLVDVIIFDTISAYGDGIVKVLMELTKLIIGRTTTVILISQIRNSFEDPRDYNTPYMKVLNQYSHIRMMLKKIESIKHQSILIGKHVSVDIYKNVMYHPYSTDIEIYF